MIAACCDGPLYQDSTNIPISRFTFPWSLFCPFFFSVSAPAIKTTLSATLTGWNGLESGCAGTGRYLGNPALGFERSGRGKVDVMRVDVVRGIKGTGGSWFFPCTVHRNHCSVFKK